ncbi:MAG: hypothetical protein QOF60_1195 [Actinomycetota bacterium]|jgi:hypothetical protein|nr:hypothetical protein [Actinomycetota bacterium]
MGAPEDSREMRPWRRAAIAVVALAGTVLGAGAGVARAQVPTTTSTTRDSGEHPTFDRSPAEGPAGTVIQVWGAGCIYYGTPWEYARVSVASVSNEPGHEYHRLSGKFPIKDDGSWQGEVPVPAGAPSGAYKLGADCYASDMVLPAGDMPFRVSEVAPPTSAEPSTTTTTAAPESPSTTSRPRALAAATTPLVTTSTTVAEAVATTLSPRASRARWRAATSLESGGGGAGPAATLWVWVLAVPSTAALVMAVVRLGRSGRRRGAGRRPVRPSTEAASTFALRKSR